MLLLGAIYMLSFLIEINRIIVLTMYNKNGVTFFKDNYIRSYNLLVNITVITIPLKFNWKITMRLNLIKIPFFFEKQLKYLKYNVRKSS